MLRCKNVVQLVASDALRDAPLNRRLAVLLHLAMCRHCRGYVRQLRRIRAAVRGLYGGTAIDAESAVRMTAAVREAAERAQTRDRPDPS